MILLPLHLLLLLLVAVLSNATDDRITPDGECPQNKITSFVRHVGTRSNVKPSFIAKVDMVTCSTDCKNNYDSSMDVHLPCASFNFKAGKNPTCEFFRTYTDPSNISLKLENNPTYFFEKVCLRAPMACAESSFTFDVRKGYRLLAEKMEKSARTESECMEECLERQCPAFEWNQKKRKCSLYTSTRRDSQITKDADVNYYENNCIHPSVRCPSGRIEFFVTRKADVPSFGVSLGVKSIRNCMYSCIHTPHFFCRSVQVDPISSECFISDESSEVAVPSSTLDLYEPFCVPTYLQTTCNRPYTFEKMITSRLDSSFFMNMLPATPIEKCLKHCMEEKYCRSVNYNVLSRECSLLSVARPDGNFTVVNDENFDYYELACLQPIEPKPSRSPATSPVDISVESTTAESRHTSAKLSKIENDKESFKLIEKGRALRQEYRHVQHNHVTSVDECLNHCKTSPFHCTSFAYSDDLQQCAVSSISLNPKNDSFEKYTQESLIFDLFGAVLKEETMFPTLAPETTTTRMSVEVAESEDDNVVDSEIFALETATFETTTEETTAQCHENGVNITFLLPPDLKYTGAVYASERFEQCRVMVEKASEFHIFIPRPQHTNSFCNALEVNSEMSSIIVMTNDRVYPHDITTKDDLFYQVSCNYDYEDQQSTSVRKGIVVGGPSPIAIAQKSEARQNISLEISKDGQIVESVFIGENLMATVHSHLPAENLRVMECTAHRVGGIGAPASVHLISDGCALLPSIMSPMRMTQEGWQSSLSAFRIDGSEQIDIVCMISVCSDGKCPKMNCDSARSKRNLQDNETSIRVDTRLRVKGDRADGPLFPQVCLEPTMYLPGVGLFLCSLISVAVSIVLTYRRSKKQDSHVEQLLSTPLPTYLGPKYMKNLSN